MSEDLSLTGEEFSLFCDVITSFHTIRNMDQMLVAIFEKLRSIVELEGISIALHDPGNKEFYFIHTVEESLGTTTSADALRFPDHQGIAGWIMSNRQPVVIEDVSTDSRYYDGFDARQDFTTKSMVCVPLQTRKGFLGVFYALNKLKGSFTTREQKIIEIISGTIAVSIENAQLYGELRAHLRSLEREKRLLLSQVRADARFTSIIGSSPPMRKMFDLIVKVLDTTTTVLIQGETGTGKELIARVIHFNGPLKEKPFLAENCGALPDELLESELFGHVRGAFTGAVSNKKGLFEMADGGTIFLDEIGEMSPLMQVKLLRVLQEGQFRPVGGSTTKQVRVRLIASTNRDLAKEVQRGHFREDLYYRINVFQVTPPPLRQRKEDILPLANHFLAKYAAKHARPVPVLAPLALDLLMDFSWPGNVRELENEMERALTLAGGKTTIIPEYLSDKLRKGHEHATDEGGGTTISSGSLKDAVRRLEVRMIREALAACEGNRSQAARQLALSRQGLHNKIASYAIDLVE